jgi:hypothetical protein
VRIQQALKTGAGIIVTACPYCIRMLNEAIEALNVKDKIKVQDISELLLTSIEFSNDVKNRNTKNKDTNILSLEQEDCHV